MVSLPDDVDVSKLERPPDIPAIAWKVMRPAVKYQKWLAWKQSSGVSEQTTSQQVFTSSSASSVSVQTDPKKVEEFAKQVDVKLSQVNVGLLKLLGALDDEEIVKISGFQAQLQAAMAALRLGRIATEQEIVGSLDATLNRLQELEKEFSQNLATQVKQKKQQSSSRLTEIQKEMKKLDEERQLLEGNLSGVDDLAAAQQANFKGAISPKLEHLQQLRSAFQKHVVE